jgi:hypothetical protein
MSVAFAIDHRSVADCPRSMLRGSAVKLLMRAAEEVGGGGEFKSPRFVGWGAGCGLGIGVIFGLHPVAPTSNTIVNTAAPSVLGSILILANPLPSDQFT